MKLPYQVGMTLVELMIASFLGIILCSVLIQSIYLSFNSKKEIRALEYILENASITRYFMTKDIMALATLCSERGFNAFKNISDGTVGKFVRDNRAWLKGRFSVNNRDEITFTWFSKIGPVQLLADLGNTNSPLLVDARTLGKSDELFITNCDSADLISIDRVFRNGFITYNNQSVGLSIAYSKGTSIYALEKVRYFLKKAPNGSLGLYREEGNKRTAKARELVSNVNQMQILYGVKKTLSQETAYLTADKINDFNKVNKLVVYLLLSSQSVISGDASSYLNNMGDTLLAIDSKIKKAVRFSVMINYAR